MYKSAPRVAQIAFVCATAFAPTLLWGNCVELQKKPPRGGKNSKVGCACGVLRWAKWQQSSWRCKTGNSCVENVCNAGWFVACKCILFWQNLAHVVQNWQFWLQVCAMLATCCACIHQSCGIAKKATPWWQNRVLGNKKSIPLWQNVSVAIQFNKKPFQKNYHIICIMWCFVQYNGFTNHTKQQLNVPSTCGNLCWNCNFQQKTAMFYTILKKSIDINEIKLYYILKYKI